MTTRVVMVNQTINTNHCAHINFFWQGHMIVCDQQIFAHFVLQLCYKK
jgi:hypothetical protein